MRAPIHKTIALCCLLVMALTATVASAQRRITPVNTAQTATQPVDDTKADTALMHKKFRERKTVVVTTDTVGQKGYIVYRDTLTNETDTVHITIRRGMQYPLLHAASVGVDIWNPLMRAFGQHYGLIDFSAQLSLHNRYKPVIETGLGIARNTPPGNNFSYRSPLSVYLRVGLDYNFMYNTSDYQYFAGVRYGCSKFSFSIDDININSSYWDEDAQPRIPAQHPLVGWWEMAMGLKVRLWGPVWAGWTLRYHSILHESRCAYGQPWYIPGYGTRDTAISGSVTISYTVDLNKTPRIKVSKKEGAGT